MLNLDDPAIYQTIGSDKVFSPLTPATQSVLGSAMYTDITRHIKTHKYRTVAEITELLRLYNDYNTVGRFHTSLRDSASNMYKSGNTSATLVSIWSSVVLTLAQLKRAAQLYNTYNAQHPYQSQPRHYLFTRKFIVPIIQFNSMVFTEPDNALCTNLIYIRLKDGSLVLPLEQSNNICGEGHRNYTIWICPINQLRQNYKTTRDVAGRKSLKSIYSKGILQNMSQHMTRACLKCEKVHTVHLGQLIELNTAVLMKKLLDPSIKETVIGNPRG